MATSAGLLSLSPSSTSPLFAPSSPSASSSFTFHPLPSPRPSLCSSPRTSVHGFFLDLEPHSSKLLDSFLPPSSRSRSSSRSPSSSPSLPSTPRSPGSFRVSAYASSYTSTEPKTDRFAAAGPIRKTHYSLLGVPPQASPKEIRLAYRKLALLHHPDVSPLHQLDTATKLFSEINEAYTTLADPQKRASYDLKLALESPVAVGSLYTTSPRQYTDASTGRVYPSMNSFYREWRQARN